MTPKKNKTTMQDKTPIQQAIEIFKSEMKGIEENPMIDRDEKLAYSSQYENFIEKLESVLPKEKEFAGNCFKAGAYYATEVMDKPSRTEKFRELDLEQFLNQLYPEK